MNDKKRKKILLVEDEILIALNEKKILEKFGYEVITATTGKKAIQIIEDIPGIDLILMDIVLGEEMDGATATESITKKNDIPIIFLTSHSEPGLIGKAKETASYGFIFKSQFEQVFDISINMALKLHESFKKKYESYTFRRSIYGNSMVPVIIMDSKSYKFLDCNRAAIPLYGYNAREELIEKTPLDVSPLRQYHDVLSSEMVKYYVEKALTEEQVIFEWLHQRPNGELWDAEVQFNVFNDNNRNLIQITLLDITERKRIELSLRQSELNLKKISNNFISGMIYQVIVTKDGGRKFTFLSDSVKLLYGILPHEGMNNPFLIYERIHEGDIEKLKIAEEKAIKEFSTFKMEVRIYEPSGKIRWSFFVSTPSKLEDGTICFDGIEFIITERKMAEEALQESEKLKSELLEKLNEAQHMAMIGSWEWDLQTNFVWWSDETYNIFGVTKDNFSPGFEENGKFIHPQDSERYNKAFQNSIKTGEPVNLDIKIVLRNGNEKKCNARGRVIFNTSAQPVRIIGTLMDITERSKADEELRTNRILLEQTFEQSPVPMVLVSMPDSIIRIANPACRRFLGIEDEPSVIGSKLMDIKPSWTDFDINGKPSDFLELPLLKSLNGIRTFHENRILVTKDGTVKYEIASSAPILDDYGNIIAGYIVMMDITDLKRTENELKESEELFKKLIEYAPYSIVVTDVKGRYVVVNKYFCEDNQLKEEEIIGKNANELGFFVEEKFNKIIGDELSAKGRIGNLELPVTDRYANEKVYLYSALLMILKNESMILHSSINITDKKFIEKELEQYRNHLELLVKERTEELGNTNEELKTINEELLTQREELSNALEKLHEAQNQIIQSEKMASLGILAAGMAHEINNPLNFINGGIYGLENYFKDNLTEHIEKVSVLFTAINVGVKRAADIVTGLSHYTKQDNFPKTNCEIHGIINNCLIQLQKQLKNKAEIIKNYTNRQHVLSGSERKLHQAILNILTNSEQSIEKKGTIDINTEINDSQLIIIITDTGCGIEENNIKKIFDPFFTTKDPGKGTGLGLSITYKIIREHNGTLEYESTLGKGTKAIIKLPITIL